MPAFPTPSPPSVIVAVTVLAFGAGGCDPGSGASNGLPLNPEPLDPALAWVGTFRGGGAGTAGSATVEWDEVALRIREETDSVPGDECDPCLLLRLDTLFEAMHVQAASDVELTVVLDREDERQTLQLLRYSGGGGVGNTVDATLRVQQGSSTTLEARFLLSR